jgi:hypothetical protein
MTDYVDLKEMINLAGGFAIDIQNRLSVPRQLPGTF